MIVELKDGKGNTLIAVHLWGLVLTVLNLKLALSGKQIMQGALKKGYRLTVTDKDRRETTVVPFPESWKEGLL